MILVALATHAGDIDQAIELAKQITEIGGASTHKAQVVVADTAPNYKVEELKKELQKAFYSVDLDVVRVKEMRGPLDPSTAPHTPAANAMFREILRVTSERGNTLPILLIEPDITVIRQDWLDQLENEYIRARASGKEILAARIPLRNYNHQLAQLPKPLTGIVRRLVSVSQDAKVLYSPIPMVIPPNFAEITQLYQKSVWTPWEITSNLELEAKIGATELITHAHDSTNWSLNGNVFCFEAPVEDKSPRSTDIDVAAIVHGTKDSSLFNLIFRAVELPEVVKQDLKAAFEIIDAKVDTVTEEGEPEVTSIEPLKYPCCGQPVECSCPTEQVDKSPEPAKVDARAAAIAARNKKK